MFKLTVRVSLKAADNSGPKASSIGQAASDRQSRSQHYKLDKAGHALVRKKSNT